MARGRTSNYDPKFCKIAYSMTQEGATDREVAEELEINESTLWRWENKYPEFRKAMQLGQEAADNRVERTLYRRAIGYSFDAIKIMQYEGKISITPYVEHVPPDPGCMQFWLKNRKGEKWRDKSDVEHSGAVDVSIKRFTPEP